MDPLAHRRFLQYRERWAHFAEPGGGAALSFDRFQVLDEEQRELDARGDDRDDDEEARFAELNALLVLD